MGDPAGIGPEVALRALARRAVADAVSPVLVGDRGVFEDTARRLRLPGRVLAGCRIVEVSSLAARDRRPGRPTREGAGAAWRAILEAVALVRRGEADGIVTAPVGKAAIRETGVDFLGHTEVIARRAGNVQVRMMMNGRTLRVVLATTHVPLADVPRRASARRVEQTIRIADRALRKSFGIPRPRLALAGLNPHAGESGALGHEEIRRFEPLVTRLRRSRIDVVGPVPGDTVFYRARSGEFDAVIALYHDQGLAPFKLVHFRDGVNVTIGLPFPRTSPDHGTAWDIAGRATADPTSMAEAVRLAARMCAAGG